MPPQSRRPAARPRGEMGPEKGSFARTKDVVPYRYDDAAGFDARSGPGEAMPKVNIVPRDTAKNGPFSTPNEPTKPGQPEMRKPFAGQEPFLPPQTAPLPESGESAAPKAAAPAEEPTIDFARNVPGKRGLVYPPGAKESEENMVDVGGFQSGQIVRDPRTGKLFRVP